MHEETKIKVDTLPEKKLKKKDCLSKDIPKIQTLEPNLDISYIKTDAPFQVIFDVVVFVGSCYGFLNVCYFLLSLISNLVCDFIAFLIPC